MNLDPNATRGFGEPPPGWLTNCLRGAQNAIVQTFHMITTARPSPTTKPTGLARVAAAFRLRNDPDKPARIRREIRALCEERKIDPTGWVELANQSDRAEERVRASLWKIPRVR